RIANRRGRHLYLRDRPHDEEVLRGDRGPESSLRDQPSREENRPGLRRALDAVAVVTQVDPCRADRSPCDEGDDRFHPRLTLLLLTRLPRPTARESARSPSAQACDRVACSWPAS